MGAILTKGFIQQGQVIVSKPIDLPDGAEVVVSKPAASDDDGPMSPQEIQRVLAGMEKIEPFDWTAEESDRCRCLGEKSQRLHHCQHG